MLACTIQCYGHKGLTVGRNAPQSLCDIDDDDDDDDDDDGVGE